MCGEKISIEILVSPHKTKMNFLYFMGREWCSDKRVDEIWNGIEWEVIEIKYCLLIDDNTLINIKGYWELDGEEGEDFVINIVK